MSTIYIQGDQGVPVMSWLGLELVKYFSSLDIPVQHKFIPGLGVCYGFSFEIPEEYDSELLILLLKYPEFFHSSESVINSTPSKSYIKSIIDGQLSDRRLFKETA